MKKLSIILLSIILCVSFCACSNAKTEDNASTIVADVGASTARPSDATQSTENASTTTVKASTARSNKGNNKSDVIQSSTTTTSKNKNSNQEPTEQDNIRVNAKDLVGGNYFD